MFDLLVYSKDAGLFAAGGPWIVDSNTVVMIALIAFLLLAYRFGWPLIRDMLDSRIDEIRSELDEAKRLRTQAEDLLKDYRAKHNHALAEAKAIVAAAQKDAQALQEKAAADLAVALQRREDAAKARIKQAEVAAIAQAQATVAAQAIASAEKMLAEKLDADTHLKLVDEAIGLVSGRLP